MANTESIARLISTTFENNPYPGDDFLLRSRQGCEPADEVLPFQGKTNWKELTVDFLDKQAGALHSFFGSRVAIFSAGVFARRFARRTPVCRSALYVDPRLSGHNCGRYKK